MGFQKFLLLPLVDPKSPAQPTLVNTRERATTIKSDVSIGRMLFLSQMQNYVPCMSRDDNDNGN